MDPRRAERTWGREVETPKARAHRAPRATSLPTSMTPSTIYCAYTFYFEDRGKSRRFRGENRGALIIIMQAGADVTTCTPAFWSGTRQNPKAQSHFRARIWGIQYRPRTPHRLVHLATSRVVCIARPVSPQKEGDRPRAHLAVSPSAGVGPGLTRLARGTSLPFFFSCSGCEHSPYGPIARAHLEYLNTIP